MSDADALLAAVLADPAADLPRLMFADALDDAGDPVRAEFIRVQIALAADPTALPLRAREQTLLSLHAAGWLQPLRARGEPLQNPGTHGRFRRGFVDEVWMPAGVFLKRADKLFRRAPVQSLRVTRAGRGELSEVLRSPHLRRLLGLTFAGLTDPRLAGELDAADWLPPVLVVRNCGLTDEDAGVIADAQACEWGWRPTLLDVSHNPLTDAGLAKLRAQFGAAVRYDR